MSVSTKTAVAALMALAPLATYAAGPLSLGPDAVGKWAGPYVGGQVGVNNTSATGLSNENAFDGGLSLGYNTVTPAAGLASPAILGADFFTEFNTQEIHSNDVSYGSNVLGVDFLAGYPLGVNRQLLPYIKFGFGDINATGDRGTSGVGARVGVGAEMWMNPGLGLVAQWVHQSGNGITNDNFTLGVNYHFGMQ